MYNPVSSLHSYPHHLSRPSSRSSLQTTSPQHYAIDPLIRPSSTGTHNRIAAERGSFSPYDDETPSPSPTLSSSRRQTDNLYSVPPTGPRLPDIPIRSPITVEHSFRSRPSSVVSTASTTRKTRPPSIQMTGPSPTTSTYTFSRPPAPSRVARPSRRDESSSDDDRSSRRSSLMPRSAVAASFDIDFSFLDEEPPPRPSSFGGSRAFGGKKERPLSASSERAAAKPRVQDTQDYFTLKALAEELPNGKRLSTSSTSSLPFPAKLPFPSRPPGPSRRISAESGLSRKSSLYSPGERPYVPSSLSAPLDASRRPSVVSFMSVESAGSAVSSAPSMMFQQGATPPLAFPAPVETGPEALEKRKRLAAFLDETASAMEGGKSLAMVLPESQPAIAQPKSLSELAEARVASPRPSSRNSNSGMEYRDSFTQSQPSDELSPTSMPQSTFQPGTYSRPPSPPSPTTADPSRVPSPSPSSTAQPTPQPARERDPNRPMPRNERSRTVYFTPDPTDQSGGETDTDDDLLPEGQKRGAPMTLGEALMLDRIPPAGLGLGGVDMRNPARSLSERSPSTIRADSPASLAAAQMASIETDEERIAKKAEKRRRTIAELVETEATYAVDMAVVRDIYLARARGAHMAQIADHVMSTGLGLGHVGPASPASPALPSASTLESRRSSAFPVGADRRPSMAPSLTKLQERRPTMVATLPNLMPGQPLMSEKDLHVVFANLEEIASLSEGFANLLDSAMGTEEGEGRDDRIGEIFVEMIPRIQQVYSTYCARHHRAIVRLQELEPTLRTYFSECKTLSHGRTNAWDLASLLIKPVQRCLKYPLLLDQILGMTPEDHPDRPLLQRANTDMLMVAEHINEYKKRGDAVARVVSKDKNAQRRDSTRSISSMGTNVTKKLLRSSQKAKSALGLAENGGDEMFDTLVALVDSTRSGVLRFSNEMRDWTKSTKAALEAQVGMVEGWIDMYAPMAGEHNAASQSHQRLCIFLDEVLIPIIEGPWRELDHEVRRSLILKTDHLLSLFESPRQVINKRNDKMLDHHRYLAKKLPSDRRGSEDFLLLSAQLLEELPRFLGSVSRYFNIIVGHFAGAQAAYHEAVQERWNLFAEGWVEQISDGSYDEIEASFAAQHQPLAQMMETLAAGLGLGGSQANSPTAASRKRGSRLSHMSVNSTMSSPANNRLSMHGRSLSMAEDRRSGNRQSYMSTTTDYSSERNGNRGSLGSTYRSSVTSDSSAPSLGPTSVDGSSPSENVTPLPHASHIRPPKGPHHGEGHHRQSSLVVHEPLGGHDRRSMAIRYDAPLPSPPAVQQGQQAKKAQYSSDSSDPSSSSATEADTFKSGMDVPRPREHHGRMADELREKYLSTYSVYMPADDSLEEEDGPLYIAEATTASEGGGDFRSGYPLHAYNEMDHIEVELEEADTAEGGSGWLLGRKVGGDGSLGWVRTEHFVMLEEGESPEEEDGGEMA